jgi:phospholipid transport system substrate-binding protein
LNPYISIAYWLFLIAFIIFEPASAATSDSAPTRVIGQLQRGLIEIDRRIGQSGEIAERDAAFAPLIESSHDLPYMAKRTIRRHWNGLDDVQRARFIEAFSGLSIATYASRFNGMGDVVFRINAERAMSGGRMEVKTELVEANGARTSLDYVLHETTDGWRIVNIVAEGVSDLALKRSQYQQILNRQSFDAVVQHMDAQRAVITAGD